MPEVRGITVAVGEWYAKTLSICLHQNMRHFSECLVVTTPQDEAVKAVASKVPGVRVFETNAFYEHGARFNKGYALELGFDVIGREGWLWIWDSDILLADNVPFDQLVFGKLHGCSRRVLDDPDRYRPSLNWADCPRAKDGGPIGFGQGFHADDPILKNRRPWYDVSFPHAGGGDCYFMRLWPPSRHAILPFDALHLGRVDTNWFGTDQAGRDLMAKYVHRNNWRRAMANHSAEAAARAGELPGRLTVPGYEPTGFEIPFERRAQEARRPT